MLPNNFVISGQSDPFQSQSQPQSQQASGGQFDQQRLDRRPTLAELQAKANQFKIEILAGETRIKDLRLLALSNNFPPESIAHEVSEVQKELMDRRQGLQKIMQYLYPPHAAIGTFPNGMEIITPQLPQMVTSQQNQPTPLSILGGGSPLTGGAQPTQRPNPISNLVPITFQYVPLDRRTFTRAYLEQWLPNHPIDSSILSLFGRNIDLWALHAEVMNMNGYQCFVQRPAPNQPGQILCNLMIAPAQWPIIAGRLGFVNFPGEVCEPANPSGAVFAVHLERVYKQCLHEFDSHYLRQLIHHRKMFILGQQKANVAENSGPGMPTRALNDLNDPKMISETMSYVSLSAQELQARGVPPQTISLVENYRNQLNSMFEAQRRSIQGVHNATPHGQPRDVSDPAAMNNEDQILQPQAMDTIEDLDAINEIINNCANLSIQESPPMQPGHPTEPMNMPSTSNEQPQERPGGGARIPIAPTDLPTQAEITAAIELVKRLKEENKHVGLLTPRPIYIPDIHRPEYNAQFERLYRMTTALDQELPHYALHMEEELVKNLVIITTVMEHRREELANNPSQCSIPLARIVELTNQITQAGQLFNQWFSMRAS